jgi:AcrR family transcriptional regulator
MSPQRRPSGGPVPRPVRRDATKNRAALLAAAITVLNQDPDAPIDAIAAAAGLSRRSVYGHFATRDELLRELLTVGANRVSDSLSALDHADSRVTIALISTRLWQEIDHVRVMAQFAVRGPFREAVAQELAPVRDLLAKTVTRGIRSGQLRHDIEASLLARLIENAALSVLDESTRHDLPSEKVRELVMLSTLGMAGLSSREATELIAGAAELSQDTVLPS